MLSPSRKSLACSIVQSTRSPWDLGNAAPPTPLGSGPVMENVNLAVDKRFVTNKPPLRLESQGMELNECELGSHGWLTPGVLVPVDLFHQFDFIYATIPTHMSKVT